MDLDRRRALGAMGALALASCARNSEQEKVTAMQRQPFGRTATGEDALLYTLPGRGGMRAEITNYGGIVVSLHAPDRQGQAGDVVLGFDTLDGYLKEHPYFGAIVGRYGNRIAKGRFHLNGQEYTLARNNGENHLHGGVRGFDKVVWKAREVPGGDAPALELSYLSKDGEEGYPGNLSATVVYTIEGGDSLKIDYTATTDKDTVVNLTNHSYFNLAGEGDILQHEVAIEADRFTPVDAGLIPTGELRPVQQTAFDFRKPTAVGARISQQDEQLKFGKGYDHNFVLNSGGGRLSPAARVREPRTGRVLEVSTSEPGMQFYTGNFLDGTLRGKGGRVYGHRHGFCMETQHFPDSPNQPQFPSTVLRAGQTYRSTTVYRFTTDAAGA
jgi:aldose 1-epimerase